MSNELALRTGTAIAEVEKQRSIAEVVAAIQVARQFPRDEKIAIDKIIMACTRPGLAESALYSYSRGGTNITGPSIRMAEAIARAMGNFQFGIRELDQRPGESTMQAYAWDVETNTRASKEFQVKHIREKRSGNVALEDSRDVYELVANLGARRLRACILQLVPQDIVDAAVEQVETTMKAAVKIDDALIKNLLEKFAEFGITKEQIEKRLQRRIDAITPALVVDLRKKYLALKDGMAAPGDFFEIAPPSDDASPQTATDKLKAAVAAKAQPVQANNAGATVTTEMIHSQEATHQTQPEQTSLAAAVAAPLVAGKKPCALCKAKPGEPHANGCAIPEEGAE
jgi:hypothetical protein